LIPTLTRRRDPKARDECWHIYYGDIRAGSITRAIGVGGVDLWGWSCGFYPGSHPGEATGGSAATFEQARMAFEAAWRVFLAKRTEADFAAWRYERDFTTWKYAMWDAGLKPPTQTQAGLSRCFCGAEITIASVDGHIRDAHRMIDEQIR
jgi:hypothetical protein